MSKQINFLDTDFDSEAERAAGTDEVGRGPLAGDVVVIDDVMTAGTAIRESMAILNESGAQGAGVVIGLDRCERGDGERSAVQQVGQDWGLTVVSVVSLHDIIAWVESNPAMAQHREALERYRERYGVA